MASESDLSPTDTKLFVDDLLALGAVRMEDYLRAPHATFRSMNTLPVDALDAAAATSSSSKASGAPQGAQKRKVDAPPGGAGQPSGKRKKKGGKGGN
jgi:hypothetical protein